jgi:hypothetical protein
MSRLRRLAIVGLLVLAAAAWLGIRGFLAQRHLNDAKAELATAKTALLDRRLDAAESAMRTAGADTMAAHRLTGDIVWKAVAHVPFAGASLAAAATVAEAADVVARQALPPAFAAARTLDPQQLRASDGTIDVDLLQRSLPDLDAAAAASAKARRNLDDLPSHGVVGAVHEAGAELSMQTDDLDKALQGVRRGVRLAPPLLGHDRPRRYFVLIQQNSESRGTGGLPGGFAVLRATDGRLAIEAQGSNADLVSGALPPPPGVPADYVKLYADDSAFDYWVNVNLSPDLPNVARVIADRWKHQSGQQVDGVVTVDSQALADLLRGSPPITVPGAPALTPANIVDYLAVGQYRDFATPSGAAQGVDASPERKQLLVRIAQVATARLVGGGGSTLELARGLSDAVTSGHLRMASDDPALAPALQEAGITGGLPTGPAPVAYPVLFNSSGGKLDYFLDRSITYDGGDCSGRSRKTRITVELVNRAPAGLPAYLNNPGTLAGVGNSTTNRLSLAVYGTRGAELVTAQLDGKKLLPDGPSTAFIDVASEAGLPRWKTLIDLPAGKPVRLVLDVKEPVVDGAARVPEQPLARPLHAKVDLPACG